MQYLDLDLDDAREVAHAWLFGNANEFFRLGLQTPGNGTASEPAPSPSRPSRGEV